jgi:hypothetical protein
MIGRNAKSAVRALIRDGGGIHLHLGGDALQ